VEAAPLRGAREAAERRAADAEAALQESMGEAAAATAALEAQVGWFQNLLPL